MRRRRDDTTNSIAANPENSGSTPLAADQAIGEGAVSVTRPAVNTENQTPVDSFGVPFPTEFANPESKKPHLLLAGIDSLDVGLYVFFDAKFPRHIRTLEHLKKLSARNGGLLLDNGRCAVLPKGVRNYPFHLQYPGFQLYLSRHRIPSEQTPNAYISLNAASLWQLGAEQALAQAQAELLALVEGQVLETRISRCDLCADLLVPEGITLEFLNTHGVTRHEVERIFRRKKRLQTCYIGDPGGDIQLRIYDKSAEILVNDKLWFRDLWGTDAEAWVWRFEYQMRREALREFQVNSLSELQAKISGLWRKLNDEWFSLRLLDNPHVSRRSLHPLWELVQSAAERLGPDCQPVQRLRRSPSPEVTGVVKRAASDLLGYAARKGITDPEEALAALVQQVEGEFANRDFAEKVRLKALKLGISPERRVA